MAKCGNAKSVNRFVMDCLDIAMNDDEFEHIVWFICEKLAFHSKFYKNVKKKKRQSCLLISERL